MAQVSSQDIRKIIIDGDPVTLVDQSKAFGGALKAAGLTKSQIRNVFGTVRQIDAGWEEKSSLRKVLLLKPRLSYQSARESKVAPLADVLTEAIDLIAQAKTGEEQKLRFGYFVDFFEAILAYHTAAGGR